VAADACDQDRVRLVQAHLVEDHRQLDHDRADAAARAPDGREKVDLQVPLEAELGEGRLRHWPIAPRPPAVAKSQPGWP